MRTNNPVIPSKFILFEPEKDGYGVRLALVFGNESIEGKCPFYESQCYHCDIGKGEGRPFTHAMNKERLDFFKLYYRAILPKVIHLVVYNSGSTLNRKEMSKKTLDDILNFITTLNNCRIVSFDSREIFVSENKIQYILRGLRYDQQLRIILGVESQSEEIRISKLNKKMTQIGILKAFETIAKFHGQIGIDINVIFQPPELVGQEAFNEAIATVRYGLRLSKEYGVPVDFNLHPYYRSSKGVEKYPNHYEPDLNDVIDIAISLKKMIAHETIAASLFIGCHSEGHAVEQGEKSLSSYRAQIRRINSRGIPMR